MNNKAISDNNGYTKLSVESCDGGWIITEKGKDVKLHVRWDSVVRDLTCRLTDTDSRKNNS